MNKTSRHSLLAVAILMAALAPVLAGCGGGSGRKAASSRATRTAARTRATSVAFHAGPADEGCESLATCYTPRQLQTAYEVRPLLERGIDGRGETVVLPELAEPQFPLPSTDIRADLARFDRIFHLPTARVRVDSSLSPSASRWLANGEEVLDTEMVHAIAPRAAIIEVLVKGDSLKNTANAVTASVSALRVGASLGDVISISAAGQAAGEHCDTSAEVAELHAALKNAARRGVTVVAASGDIGPVGEPCDAYKGLIGGHFSPVKEANLPASDPLVLAAGGTSLTASDETGNYLKESAWGLPFGDPGTHFQASGGGISRLFRRPAYQRRIPRPGNDRGVPDVSSTASPHTAMAVISVEGKKGYSVHGSGGTSAAAPLWAALIALADERAGRRLGFVNPALYRIAAGADYHRAFHDVTDGSNTVSFPPRTIKGYAATPGWDPVTGLGSPDAAVLVPLLDRYHRPAASPLR
jgi:subtilase family serine protease